MLDIIDDGSRVALKLEGPDVEFLRHDGARVRVQHVAAGRIHHPGGDVGHSRRSAAGQRTDIYRVLENGPAGRKTRYDVEKMPAIRQEARPEVLALAALSIEPRHLSRDTARGRHHENAFLARHRKVRKQDRSVFAPAWK